MPFWANYDDEGDVLADEELFKKKRKVREVLESWDRGMRIAAPNATVM